VGEPAEVRPQHLPAGVIVERAVPVRLQHHAHPLTRHLRVADLHGVLHPDVPRRVEVVLRDQGELGVGGGDDLLQLLDEAVVPPRGLADIEGVPSVEVGEHDPGGHPQADRIGGGLYPLPIEEGGRDHGLPVPGPIGVAKSLDTQLLLLASGDRSDLGREVGAQRAVVAPFLFEEDPDPLPGGLIDHDPETARRPEVGGGPQPQEGHVLKVRCPVHDPIQVVGITGAGIAVVVDQEDGSPLGGPLILTPRVRP